MFVRSCMRIFTGCRRWLAVPWGSLVNAHLRCRGRLAASSQESQPPNAAAPDSALWTAISV